MNNSFDSSLIDILNNIIEDNENKINFLSSYMDEVKKNQENLKKICLILCEIRGNCKKYKQLKDSFCVIFDNCLIYENNPTETYKAFFKKFGLENATKVNVLRNGEPIVTTKNLGAFPSGTVMQDKVDEYYIYTNLSTEDKIKVIRDFCEKAGISDKVKICEFKESKDK